MAPKNANQSMELWGIWNAPLQSARVHTGTIAEGDNAKGNQTWFAEKKPQSF